MAATQQTSSVQPATTPSSLCNATALDMLKMFDGVDGVRPTGRLPGLVMETNSSGSDTAHRHSSMVNWFTRLNPFLAHEYVEGGKVSRPTGEHGPDVAIGDTQSSTSAKTIAETGEQHVATTMNSVNGKEKFVDATPRPTLKH